MKSINTTRLTMTLLALGLSAGALAQQPTSDNFPAARDRPATCEDFKWSDQMLQEYPRVANACQEVVTVDGQTFARFNAQFVRVESDGVVNFTVRDRNESFVDELTIQPAQGQMAYINDRPTEFRNLRTSDAINLYAAEDEYGFATQPRGPREQRAQLRTVAAQPIAATRTPAEPLYDRTTAVAQVDERAPRMLPQTAGSLPWVALAGMLSLLGGLGLAIQRKL